VNNQEILDNAPDAEGCAVDVAVNTKKAEIMYIKRNARGDKIYRKGKGWNYLQGTLGTHWTIRSLEDIKRIAELEKCLEEFLEASNTVYSNSRELGIAETNAGLLLEKK
jgi:hypothetical protein